MTYAEIEQTALAELDEFLADNPDADEHAVREWIESNATASTPAMTTNLFQLVVDDNALAFYEADDDGYEPFQVLFNAVQARLSLAMIERWQSAGGEA